MQYEFEIVLLQIIVTKDGISRRLKSAQLCKLGEHLKCKIQSLEKHEFNGYHCLL